MSNSQEWNAEVRGRLRSFRDALRIDGNNLGEECLGQAVLYEQIGELVAQIKGSTRASKDTLDFTMARLKKEARTNPERFSLTKITEAALDEVVNTHDEVVSAKKEYAEAQYLSDCASVLLTAAEQRKSMLKDSVSLAIHQLYSSQHDLSQDQYKLTAAGSKVNEDDINNVRRAVAVARQNEPENESDV